jgi:pantothenate kinase type III
VLARHLPKQAHAIVFGEEAAVATKKVATSAAAMRRIPAISIYVISTNREHESALKFLFQDVTTRMFRLQATDFFSKEQGVYEGMGVDRVAVLKAALTLFGAPVMVMDAGTAWTYTALDAKEQILGGGITPGVAARFRAMSDYCGELPIIEFESYQKAIREAKDSKQPFPTFAKNTKSAMMGAVFSEIAGQCRNLAKQFVDAVKVEKDKDDDGDKPPPKKPTIALTGGDSAVLEDMLKENQSGLIVSEPGTQLPADSYDLHHMKHLGHYGIGELLKTQLDSMKDDNPDDKLRHMITGQRVAKKFDVSDYDGDLVYRGSVISIKADQSDFNNDLYLVRYDDGDSEHLEMKEVHGKC